MSAGVRAFLVAPVLLATATWADTAPVVLRDGDVHQATIVRDEAQRFELKIEQPGVWRVAAEQHGIDLELLVTDPAGHLVAQVATPLYRKGTVWWAAEVTEAGTYTLDVRTKADTAESGDYVLRVDELSTRPASHREASLAMARAATLQRSEDPELLRQAIDVYGRARALWRREGAKSQEAETLYSMARILSGRLAGEIPDAIRFLEQAAELFAAAERKRFEAAARADIGLAHWKLGALDDADTSLERAVLLFGQLGDSFGYGTALNTQCMIQHSRGALREALACYEVAVARVQQADATAHAAAMLNNIGYAYDALGEPQAALAQYEEALEMYRGIDNRAGEAQVLNNMAAVIFRGEGDGERALARYEEAREIYEALGNRRQIAAVLHNQGVTYRRLGNHRRAVMLLTRALEMRRDESDARGVVITLNALGETYWRQGLPARALPVHQEALTLARQIEHRRDEGYALALLGRAEVAEGNVSRGLEHLADAVGVLERANELFFLAWTHHERGSSLLTVGDDEAAEVALNRALELRRRMTDRAGEAETLEALARLDRSRGDLETASTLAEQALVIVEDLEGRILGPDLRMSFLATRASVFETAIETLMDRHKAEPNARFDIQAFGLSERSRARTLFEILRRPSSTDRSDASANAIEAQRRLDRRLDAKVNRLVALRGRGKERRPEVATLEAEIQSLLTERDVLIGTGAGGVSGRPQDVSVLDIEGLQSALGTDTVLLEFALGRDRSFLWWVDHEQVASFELPPRATLNRGARDLHLAWSRPEARSVEAAQTLARTLSRQVLGPVWDRLDGRRLAIVADGGLRRVPFAALPVPDGLDNWRPLVDLAEVVHLPSLSVLVRQRQRGSSTKAPSRSIAIFADPVFDLADPRVRGSGDRPDMQPNPDTVEVVRSGWREASLDLLRLPQSRKEAERIASLASGDDVWLALDRTASRSRVTDGRLHRFGIVHFATHGLVVENEPELSGLALSMVDEQGQPVDGFLRLRDIYRLDLGAELVVLSGCRTALGQNVRGEGLVGLSRAFLSAGAERVVASLWRVEDRATAQLMTLFYEAMWRRGLRPAAALRQTQQVLRGDPRFRAPAHWAGFVHQGDWR